MKVAIIPARGGSKRIPHKNIRLFAGKPIIAHSIIAARNCGLFDRIIVSTDSELVASVSREWGAETPFVRPLELSDDRTGTNAVVAHCVDWLITNATPPEVACCIYATAPFVTVAELKRGYDILIATRKSFAYSVTSFPSPIQRALRISAHGSLTPIFPQWIESRSQDLEDAYRDAGQFYWGLAEAFRNGAPLFYSHAEPVILPRYQVQDIDTIEDWDQAELMYAAWKAKMNNTNPPQ